MADPGPPRTREAPRLPTTGVAARVRLILGVALVVLIGIPLARLVGVALGHGPATVIETLQDPAVASAIGNSAWTAFAAAALAVAAGTAAALATERGDLPARGWLRAGLLIPLLLPPFITAFGWTRAYGPRGLTDQLVGLQVPGLYGPLGIVLVLAVSATPIAWLIVAAALATRVEPDLERAARASGASPWTTLRTVTGPLLRPALLSAAVVSFVFSVNAFGVPAVLGTPAGFATITTRLYQDLARSSDPAAFVEAAILASTLAIVALAVVGPVDAWLTGRSVGRTGESTGSRSAPHHGDPRRRAASAVLGTLIVVLTIVPFIAVVLTSLTRAVGLAPVPANWTLANFGETLDGRFLDGLVHSLLLATAAASLVVLLGGALAAVSRGGGLVRTSATFGFAIPGSALAIAMLLAYGGWLRDSLAIILLAYLAKFWALGHRSIAGSMDRVAADAVRAARASGAGLGSAIRSVVLPVLRPSIIAGWLVVFVFSLHELTMSALLHGPRSVTLAVVVLDAQQLGDPTVTAALAVLLVGIVAVVLVPLALVGRRSA